MLTSIPEIRLLAASLGSLPMTWAPDVAVTVSVATSKCRRRLFMSTRPSGICTVTIDPGDADWEDWTSILYLFL